MSKILPAHWSANFSMNDGREKSRMKDVGNELASLVSSFNLEYEKMPYQRICAMAREKIIDA